MRETNLTLEQIETIITGYADSPYYIGKNIVIPNCNWGFLNHEADLLVMTKAKRLIEVEIKRTWSDFLADFKKAHTHEDPKLGHLYYAVPLSIGERVFNYLYEGKYNCNRHALMYSHSEVTAYTEKNPNKCGLIVYASTEEIGWATMRVGVCCVNVLAQKMNDYRVSTEEELKLLRLLGMRIWKLKKKLAEYQVETSLFKEK